MKVLAINNGRDRTACAFIEYSKEGGYRARLDLLTGNITEEIKDLCRTYDPDEVILQLPPTGLDKTTQKAIQEGFCRNVAAAFNIKRIPLIKDLLKARASLGCYRREQVRQFFSHVLSWDHLRRLNRRQQSQIASTLALAFDAVKAAERDTA